MTLKTKKKKTHAVEVAHLDKLYFPQSGITKGDVIAYYQKVAPYMLAFVKDHILVMQRFPYGITQEGFYQKQISDYFPSWIKQVTITLHSGDKQSLVVLEKPEDIVYLANQAVLVFHGWMSTFEHPDYPDKLVFDFDPLKKDLKTIRWAVTTMKKKLEQHGLVPFLMTTGSRAYHIVVPLKPVQPFDVVHAFAKQLAQEIADEYPDLLTTNPIKIKRKGRILVDYMRNSFGATAVAPFSIRAIEGAPVATPLAWNELGKTDPQKYTIKNIFRRLARKKDPWKDFWKSAKKLPKFT